MSGRSLPAPYRLLPRPGDPVEGLSSFIADSLGPGLSVIRVRRDSAAHKTDYIVVAQLALALREQVTAWLADAERLLVLAQSNEWEAVHTGRRLEAESAAARPSADMTKALVKDKTSTLEHAISLLKGARDDLRLTISVAETIMRSFREEEFRTMDGIGSLDALFASPTP